MPKTPEIKLPGRNHGRKTWTEAYITQYRKWLGRINLDCCCCSREEISLEQDVTTRASGSESPLIRDLGGGWAKGPSENGTARQ
jgi:hypothetical protein